MKFLKIENNPEKAVFFQEVGVDRIFLDLEIIGKKERQGHLNTVISSHHSIDDVKRLSNVLTITELLVRINPIYDGSGDEIEKVINDGADVIMLPMFKTKEEVEFFVSKVNNRAKTCLLLETSQALCRIEEILKVPGIDEVHIGLNDLHLSMKLDFMFELLSGGIVDYIIDKIKPYRNIKYGFGGIAPLNQGLISGEMILKEHIRLNSSMVILSRNFDISVKKDINEFKTLFMELKNRGEELYKVSDASIFSKNRETFAEKVKQIINKT